MAASKPLLREGYLLKRQRGKSPNADLKKLRFQQRYITLDENILDYFDQKKGTKKGSFPIKRIKIIEVVPYETFGKLFCFQVGDEEEVMYFKAKSEKIRKEWMEAFRIASVTLNKNDMCDWYHTGAFGKVNARWSCCLAEKRESKGCRRTTNTQRSRPASLSTQWEHVSSTEEQDSKDDPLSESVPSGHSATCNWGDEEVQNEIEYYQSPELEDLESETSHSGEKDLSLNDNDMDLGNRADSVGSPARGVKEMLKRSIDSGLDDVGVRARAGSQGSNFSTKGYSLSPASFRRRKTPLQEASSLAENVNAIPESDVTSSFKTESTIISSVFRGTQTLITASQDACVCVTDVTEYASLQDQEQTSSTAVGSVDVWKKYLAIGFPNIKLVDLDTKEKKDFLRSSSAEGDKSAQFVTFTPEGELLSYESDSSIVHVWPQVTSMWSNIPDTEVKPHLLILEGVQEIQSLSVSPDPEDPLIATVIKSTGVDERELRIYNYKTEELKQKVTLKESASKPIAVFHPFDKFVAIGNGQSLLLYFVQKGSLLQLEEFDQSITSLCFYPTGSHLTIGLSSGEVKSYKGLSSAPDLELVASHSKPGDQDPASATSITYSKDCNILSVGYSNGKVHLWQVPLIPTTLIVQTNHDVHLLREKEMKVTSEGAQFVSQDDGYIISAAPGAVSKGSSVTLRHGVVPHGAFDQFEFPKGVYPVSAILSVQPTSDWKFLKPISIALPHFMSCETEDDCTKLIVLKACHVTDENGVSKYRFKKMPKKNLTLFSVRDKKNGMVWPYVSYSSDHCCYWCVGTYNKSDTDKAMFCLTEAKPKSTEAVESREFHFCLSYYLPTCIQAVEEQYPCSEYKMKHLAVTFSDEKDPVISIQFECKVNGWSFKLQGGNKIYKKDLCFLDYPSCPVLVKMCKDRQYPPRFILEVDAHEATKSICTKVAFPGVKEYFKRATPSSDIKLKFHPQAIVIQHSTPRRLLTSSGSDPFTPGSGREAIPHQHPFQSAMADFTDVPPKKLAFYLFTKDIITVDDYEMTKKLSMDSNADTEELNMDTLVKAYRVLKSNPQKIDGICFALKKFKYVEAQKLTTESETYEKLRTKFSRSGSAESSSSFLGGGYVSASERLSEPDVDTVAVETESGDGGDNHYPVEQPAGHFEYSTPAMESTPTHDTSSHSLTQSNWPLTCTMPTIIDSTTLSGIAPFLAPCTGNENLIPSSNANS